MRLRLHDVRHELRHHRGGRVRGVDWQSGALSTYFSRVPRFAYMWSPTRRNVEHGPPFLISSGCSATVHEVRYIRLLHRPHRQEDSLRPVEMMPGAYELTVILCSASSSAGVWVVGQPSTHPAANAHPNVMWVTYPHFASNRARRTWTRSKTRHLRILAYVSDDANVSATDKSHSISAHPSSPPWTPHLKRGDRFQV